MIGKYVKCQIYTNYGVFEFYGKISDVNGIVYQVSILKKIKWPPDTFEPVKMAVFKEEIEIVSDDELDVALIILE